MTDTGWDVIDVQDDLVAVVPRRDLVGHAVADLRCVCGPHVELVPVHGQAGRLLVHEALDGRP